jgi:hypothetical protein
MRRPGRIAATPRKIGKSKKSSRGVGKKIFASATIWLSAGAASPEGLDSAARADKISRWGQPRSTKDSTTPVKETMMTIEENLSRLRAHRDNIHRYRRLLATRLSELERAYILKRLQDEEAASQALIETTFPFSLPSTGQSSRAAA